MVDDFLDEFDKEDENKRLQIEYEKEQKEIEDLLKKIFKGKKTDPL